jgi:2-hydroxy-3-oxopropionate reductase
MKLGFIGLGVMGRPMALNLMKHGHEMAVYGRRAASVEPLVAAGARAWTSPREVAEHADVIFTMVTTSGDVEAVVLGPEGVAASAREGSVVVDMETISPNVARRVAAHLGERSVDMLDAPVSGGPPGAVNATLSIMVGGKTSVLERVRPLFECLGTTIVHVGENGAGQTAKACNQLALLVAAQGVAEALNLARAGGIDPAKARAVMMGGLAGSRVLDLFGKRMIERDFAAGIETRLYHKDLGIALDLARALGEVLPAGALVMRQIDAMMERGDGANDLSAIVRVIESMSTRGGNRL